MKEKEALVTTELEKRKHEHKTYFDKVDQMKRQLIATRQAEITSQLRGYKQVLDMQLYHKRQEVEQAKQHAAAVKRSFEAELEHKGSMVAQRECELRQLQLQLEQTRKQSQASVMMERAHDGNIDYEQKQKHLHHAQKQDRRYQTMEKQKNEELASIDRAVHSQRKLEDLETQLNSELFEKDQNIKRMDTEIMSQEATIQRKTAIVQGLHQQLDHLHSMVIAKSQVSA